MQQLAERGWKIGLRFDPLVRYHGFEKGYAALFEAVRERIRAEQIHSVTLGAMRFPNHVFDVMSKLYPDQALYAAGLQRREQMVSYPVSIEEEMLGYCQETLQQWIPQQKLFLCRCGGNSGACT
jgi:spore photoproduct lyase